MRRILVYSHDTYGLGNIRRMLAIVEDLTKKLPDVCVLILSGSPLMQSFRLPPKVDYIKLPCLHRSEQGDYGSRYLDLPSESLSRLRSRLILTAAQDFEPDLVLVDKKPLGVLGELEPTLRYLYGRARLMLVLREILDTASRTQALWQRKNYYATVEAYYDAVLVLGPKTVFDTAREYAFTATIRRRLHHCGYIRKCGTIRHRDIVRAELRITDTPLALLTAGGGQDGLAILCAALDALAPELAANRLHALVVSGPEMVLDELAVLRRCVSAQSRTSLIQYSDDLLSYMNAADVVVVMAGYNTATEILGLSKRAVLIPRTEPSLEQHIRASRLQALGLCTMVELERTNEQQLRATILAALVGEPPAPDICGVGMNGLERVTQSVIALLDGLPLANSRMHEPLQSVPLPPITNHAILVEDGQSLSPLTNELL